MATLVCVLHEFPPYLSHATTVTVDLDRPDSTTLLRAALHDDFYSVQAKSSIPVTHIQLWRANIPIDDSTENRVANFPFERNAVNGWTMLYMYERLSTYFPELPSRCIHVVGRIVPLSRPTNPGTALKRTISEPDDSVAKRRRIALECIPDDPPSSLASPAEFKRLQRRSGGPLLHCNRPSTASSLPVTLMHPILGQFVDECSTHQPTERENLFVAELSARMSEFYEGEASRAKDFRDLILKHFELLLVEGTIPGTTYITDGHASVREYVHTIFQSKDEICGGHAEPFLQSCLNYAKFTARTSATAQQSTLPCIHIVYFGPYLGFAGSALSDRVHYDILTPIFPLACSPHDTAIKAQAARAFGAFANAVRRLEQYYKDELPAQLTGSIDQPRNPGFPYPSSYTSLSDGSTVTFTLDEQSTPGRLIYFGQHIAVKFVRSYSKDLHLLCAAVGHAPKLLGFEQLPGSWFMAVMERLDSQVFTKYSSLVHDFPPASLLRDALKALVMMFHDKGFVHGDLRDSNLLVAEDGHLMLLDFDWSGQAGEVRYPSNVNRSEIFRPEGAVDGELITKEHDVCMMEYMFQDR